MTFDHYPDLRVSLSYPNKLEIKLKPKSYPLLPLPNAESFALPCSHSIR